jgi:HAE1 family hydrophobic/amphiphilic exporter-1/multidrug efflux pump
MVEFPNLIACFGLIYMFFTLCKKETAPMTTVGFVLRMSTPKVPLMNTRTDSCKKFQNWLMTDSCQKVALVITSPGFGLHL